MLSAYNEAGLSGTGLAGCVGCADFARGSVVAKPLEALANGKDE